MPLRTGNTERFLKTLKGKNTLIVLPTGADQFPPVWTGNTAIVLMPIISLMLDQAKAMQLKGIEATYFGAGQPKDDVVDKLRAGKLLLLFTTPESFFTCRGQPLPVFLEMGQQKKIGLIALDEAHLISNLPGILNTARDPSYIVTASI